MSTDFGIHNVTEVKVVWADQVPKSKACPAHSRLRIEIKTNRLGRPDHHAITLMGEYGAELPEVGTVLFKAVEHDKAKTE